MVPTVLRIKLTVVSSCVNRVHITRDCVNNFLK